jgi:hypothetical protein
MADFRGREGRDDRGAGRRNFGSRSGDNRNDERGQRERADNQNRRPSDSRGSGNFRSRDDRPRQDRGERSYSRSNAPREHNAKDLRSSNRVERPRSPEIDADVTGAELDRVTRAQLKTLESKNAEWVSKHLVMAGRLLDEDPELAFQHALAASRRGGRMAPVREAVGLTAYAAGHYGEALREFRTFRRISGSNEHLPVMADCERGLGRPDRALELTRSEDANSLDTAGKVELAIVASGARSDLEQHDAAVAALEIPQLDRNRAFSFSPRLFRAYADALDAVNRGDEAQQWRRQAMVAESALGVGEFAEPEIIDLADEEPEMPPRSRADVGGEEKDSTSRSDVKASVPGEAGPLEAEADDANSGQAVAANDGTADPVNADVGAEEAGEPGTAQLPDGREDD